MAMERIATRVRRLLKHRLTEYRTDTSTGEVLIFRPVEVQHVLGLIAGGALWVAVVVAIVRWQMEETWLVVVFWLLISFYSVLILTNLVLRFFWPTRFGRVLVVGLVSFLALLGLSGVEPLVGFGAAMLAVALAFGCLVVEPLAVWAGQALWRAWFARRAK